MVLDAVVPDAWCLMVPEVPDGAGGARHEHRQC